MNRIMMEMCRIWVPIAVYLAIYTVNQFAGNAFLFSISAMTMNMLFDIRIVRCEE